MKKHIILTRELKIECLQVVGVFSKAQKRDEILLILQRAKECGGKTDATDIARNLLFDEHSRRNVAERLLKIAEHYGLLKKDASPKKNEYALTEQGEDSLQENAVFVPEKGTWKIWISRDRLLPHPILRIEPFQQENAHTEIYNTKPNQRAKQKYSHLPEILKNWQGKTLYLHRGKEKIAWRIDEFGDKIEVSEAIKHNLKLSWDVLRGKLTIDGTLEDSKSTTYPTALSPSSPIPKLSWDEVWQELLQHYDFQGEWDRKKEILCIPFDQDVNARERMTMQRDLSISKPKLKNYSEFSPLTIENVPLSALTGEDAQEWAEWRQRKMIETYASKEKFEEWSRKAKEPFSEFSIHLPTRSELAHQAWNPKKERPSAMNWHLMAAEDWSL